MLSKGGSYSVIVCKGFIWEKASYFVKVLLFLLIICVSLAFFLRYKYIFIRQFLLKNKHDKNRVQRGMVMAILCYI